MSANDLMFAAEFAAANADGQGELETVDDLQVAAAAATAELQAQQDLLSLQRPRVLASDVPTESNRNGEDVVSETLETNKQPAPAHEAGIATGDDISTLRRAAASPSSASPDALDAEQNGDALGVADRTSASASGSSSGSDEDESSTESDTTSDATTSSDADQDDEDEDHLLADYDDVRRMIDAAMARADSENEGDEERPAAGRGERCAPAATGRASLFAAQELFGSTAPPLLDVCISPEDELTPAGCVMNVVEGTVVVRATPGSRALQEGSVLVLADGCVIGAVEDIFGPVQAPMYVLRLAFTDKEIKGSAACMDDKGVAGTEQGSVPCAAVDHETEEKEEGQPGRTLPKEERLPPTQHPHIPEAHQSSDGGDAKFVLGNQDGDVDIDAVGDQVNAEQGTLVRGPNDEAGAVCVDASAWMKLAERVVPGVEVFSVGRLATHVLPEDLKVKGYDEDDGHGELGDAEMQFSDDEAEAEYKRKLKAKRKGLAEPSLVDATRGQRSSNKPGRKGGRRSATNANRGTGRSSAGRAQQQQHQQPQQRAHPQAHFPAFPPNFPAAMQGRSNMQPHFSFQHPPPFLLPSHQQQQPLFFRPPLPQHLYPQAPAPAMPSLQPGHSMAAPRPPMAGGAFQQHVQHGHPVSGHVTTPFRQQQQQQHMQRPARQQPPPPSGPPPASPQSGAAATSGAAVQLGAMSLQPHHMYPASGSGPTS